MQDFIPSAAPIVSSDASKPYPKTTLGGQLQAESVESKSLQHSASGTAANASVASTVVSSGGDGKASDTARMVARIDHLERELDILHRENAALKHAAQSGATAATASLVSLQAAVLTLRCWERGAATSTV
jgi:hypothetical protein